MTQTKFVKLIIFVPETHAYIVRQAIGMAGAGRVGNYSFCSFSSKGIGRFVPMKDANPTVGFEYPLCTEAFLF